MLRWAGWFRSRPAVQPEHGNRQLPDPRDRVVAVRAVRLRLRLGVREGLRLRDDVRVVVRLALGDGRPGLDHRPRDRTAGADGGLRDDPPGLADPDQADALRVDAGLGDEEAGGCGGVARELVDRRHAREVAGVVTARLADPTFVVREHGDPPRDEHGVEPVRLLAQSWPGPRDVHVRRVWARSRRDRERAGERGAGHRDAHLVLPDAHPRGGRDRSPERAGVAVDRNWPRGEAEPREAGDLDLRRAEVAERCVRAAPAAGQGDGRACCALRRRAGQPRPARPQ